MRPPLLSYHIVMVLSAKNNFVSFLNIWMVIFAKLVQGIISLPFKKPGNFSILHRTGISFVVQHLCALPLLSQLLSLIPSVNKAPSSFLNSRKSCFLPSAPAPRSNRQSAKGKPANPLLPRHGASSFVQ